jgi:citrate lyase beta subunit
MTMWLGSFGLDWVDSIVRSSCCSAELQRMAERICREFEQAEAQGKGAISLDGKMIDMPMYKWAIKILQRVPPSPPS